MTLLHFDGFRSYLSENYGSVDFEATVTEIITQQHIWWYLNKGGMGTDYSRFGSPDRGLLIERSDYGGDNHFRYELESGQSPQTVIVGVVFYKNSTGDPTAHTTYSLINISDSHVDGNKHINACINSAGNIEVYRDTTLLGTSSGAQIQNYTWHCLEIKVYIHNTAGTVDIELDGVNILSLTSQDTLTGSNAYARKFMFHPIHNDLQTYFDCIWIVDTAGSAPQNDFLGDCRCDVIRPDGVGNQSDFTPSAGSNYENVDDITPDDDTTYNDGASVNDQDSYALPSLSSGGTIFGVKNSVCIKKTDAGVRKGKILTRSNATFYKSNEINLSSSYKTYGKVYQNNPDDAAAWEEADVNGMEVGVEVSL